MSPKADGAAILYLFEDYALDTDRRELVKADRSIAVQPPVFDVLAFFVPNRGRVVTKDKLIEAVWDGRVVSESTLTSRINATRTDRVETPNLASGNHAASTTFADAVVDAVVPLPYRTIERRFTRRLRGPGVGDSLAGRRQIILIEESPWHRPAEFGSNVCAIALATGRNGRHRRDKDGDDEQRF